MQHHEFSLKSRHRNRKFLADIRLVKNGNAKPVIIFNHGFKGFKDWGPFNLVSAYFARMGFAFIKMNFSHNGTTPERPDEFADLEAFGNNNLMIELDDTALLMEYLMAGKLPVDARELDLSRIYQIGHSRGGAHTILNAWKDDRIKKIVTWAAVNNLQVWHSTDELEAWKNEGVIYIHNSRTHQDMPLYYQLVENYIHNRERLSVSQAVKELKIPLKAFHGKEDKTVPLQAAQQMKSWNPSIEIEIVEGADHVFGASHPFASDQLPIHLRYIADRTIEFLTN